MSLKLALDELRFGICFHLYELIEHVPERIKYFEQAERGEDVNWDALFDGYHSAVDFPVIRYYKQVIAKYPDAKIIQTTRDPESWYKSFSETILWATQPDVKRILRMMIRLPFSSTLRKKMRVLKFNGGMIRKMLGENFKDKEAAIEMFNLHNQDVLAKVPKDRMLIYDVKQGWEPLCTFLNVPVPNTPFPKTNSTQEFLNNVKSL
ncbi:MAG: hypothetical protein LH473_07915 [Chitinophagales bacterium]|nr:hypothetical protein [Chitinophagales bacterium]